MPYRQNRVQEMELFSNNHNNNFVRNMFPGPDVCNNNLFSAKVEVHGWATWWLWSVWTLVENFPVGCLVLNGLSYWFIAALKLEEEISNSESLWLRQSTHNGADLQLLWNRSNSNPILHLGMHRISGWPDIEPDRMADNPAFFYMASRLYSNRKGRKSEQLCS